MYQTAQERLLKEMCCGGAKSLPFLCHTHAKSFAFTHVKTGVSGVGKGTPTYKPSLREGRPVWVWVYVTLEFITSTFIAELVLSRLKACFSLC